MSSKIGVMQTAPQLFDIARKAAERHVKTNAAEDGLTAIVFAAVSLEALVNELHELVSLEIAEDEVPHPKLSAFVQIVREIENSHGLTRLKYLLASYVLRGRTYDKGAQPYQDYELLTKLRDALVHLKPTVLVEENGDTDVGIEGVFKQLQKRGLVESLPANVLSTLPALVSTNSVVKWAMEVAASMAQSFISMFP
ncbi:MAG TPA: hypothetical protein VNB49_13225, partial [Candidatus Dormibacteraeota bacterium]|nr:hypothetical protein [Candidatus Dormibacteraeota bacterium]